ncbi:MAG: hypothetical protein HDQ88_08785 [Clostridia bacterium]|nr:hypothetical protein [Clostridia bacterium]
MGKTIDRMRQFELEIEPHLPQPVIEGLDRLGFFKAPASIGYHGSYPGGLYDHSYAVTTALLELTKKLSLKWNRPCGPYVVGMFHDLCKTDNYKYDRDTDKWTHDKDTLMPGHGDKSILIAQRLLAITEEETMCIRWHMGAFDDKSNWDYYCKAIAKYPNVLYAHTADMIASQIRGT